MKKTYSKYEPYKPAELLLSELHNEKKELAVLGAIFLLQDMKPIIHYLSINLLPEHFYNLKFRQVYEMAVDKAMLDGTPAYQDIPDEILETYDFESVNYTNYKEDVKDIIQLFNRRQEIEAYAKGYSVLQGGGDLTEALSFIENKITNTSNRIISSETIKLEDVYNVKGKEKGVITGFKSFDNAGVKFLNGQLIAIGADTGAGKTTFMINIIANELLMGNKVLMFSLEQPAIEIEYKLLTILTKYPEKMIKEGMVEREIVEQAYKIIKGNIVILYKDGMTTSEIKSQAKLYHKRKEFSLICVDYWQLIQGAGDNALERYVNTADGLLSTALSLELPVIAIGQVDKGSSRMTNLDRNAFSGSKQLSNNASYIIMLQKDKDDTIAEIVKSRKPTHYGRRVTLQMNKATEKLTEKQL
jgi:replicative DNA helicase